MVFVDSLQLTIEIAAVELSIEERKQNKTYDRAKQKRETKILEQEYWDEK